MVIQPSNKCRIFPQKTILSLNLYNKRTRQISKNGKKFIEFFKNISGNPILHQCKQEKKGESICINNIYVYLMMEDYLFLGIQVIYLFKKFSYWNI